MDPGGAGAGSGCTRREFLQAGLAAGGGLLAGVAPGAVPQPLPERVLGGTGLKVPILGFGGYPFGTLADAGKAVGLLSLALDLGVTYVDTAPSYSDGESEKRVGRAIRGRRERVILATKTLRRDRKGMLEELDGSLRRLGADRVDILQFHALRARSDLDQILGAGGALEGALEARRKGRLRFIGITGHEDPEVLAEALRRHPFDTVLLTLNAADAHRASFHRGVIPLAREKGAGIIAMKVFVNGRLPRETGLTPAECLPYVWSCPVDTAIVGCVSEEELRADVEAARAFRPLEAGEMRALEERTAKAAAGGIEYYKRRAGRAGQGR